MNRLRGPFNVTTTGQAGAVAALADADWVEKTRAHTVQWRQWLTEEVTSLGNKGLRPIPSFANFVMIEFPESGPVTAAGANEALLHEGVIARYLAVQNMPRCLRISIGTEEETRAAATALRRYVETAGA
jgi:histidinol-phosphate aminotransferase